MHLKEFLSRLDVSTADFAKQGDWSQQIVISWVYGKTIPSHKNQLRIMDMTLGLVDPNSWIIPSSPDS